MRRIITALAIAAIGAAGAVRAEQFTYFYDVYLGGLRGGELRLTMDHDDSSYTADAEMASAGLAAWIFPGRAQAHAQGRWADAAPTPLRFDAEGAFSGKRQAVAMAFAPGEPLRLEADPPLRVRGYDAKPSSLEGALDPLSAAVALLAPARVDGVCGRTVSVFDSRRRFDLSLGAAEREGELIRCEGSFKRIAGYKDKHLRLPPHPFTAWWRVEDGRAVFERAQAPTDFGYAVAKRRG